MAPLFHAVGAAAMVLASPAEQDGEQLPIVLGGALSDDATLRIELELRLPGHEIAGKDDALPSAFFWIGSDASAPAPDAFELKVITSDGRLYRRAVSLPEQGDRARVTAGAIANLVDGIERRTVTPDETEVAIPVEKTKAEPEPDEPEEPEPEPEDSEPAAPQVLQRPTVPTHRPLHVGVGLAVGLGLGPPAGLTGVVGVGGGVGASWVRPGGLLLGGSLRAMGWARGGVSIARVRVWARAGYVWTGGRWSAMAAGGPFVEPLWIRPDVREVGGSERTPVPLVGLAATAGPRLKLWARDDGPSLWMTLDLEAAGSGEARRDMGVLQVRTADTGDALLRAGGVELTPMVGVELR